MKIRPTLRIVFALAFLNLVMPVQAQVVPGTGQEIVEVFDDFEDLSWSYTPNLPKSSANIDKVERHPAGFSNNRTFLESMYRGTPDFVKRIDTPAGGIPGSTGALAMQTLNSGIPGERSHTFQQDDLIAGVQQKLGYMMPVSWTPSYVCRVYVPPFDKWERRSGSHFGYRADCTTTLTKQNSVGRFFKNFGSYKALEQYWPGFFIQLNLKHMNGEKEDSAVILIRSDDKGHEVPGPKITHAGWWTLGMTFTPDGKVHYYAHEGVANLRAKDHLYSSYPYGYKCEQTSTYFFNIVNQDDGRTWSTRWIVDDPKVYVATGSYRPPVQQQVAQKPQPVSPPQAAIAKPAESAAISKEPAKPAPATSAVKTPPATIKTVAKPSPAETPSTPKLASKPVEIPLLPPQETPPSATAETPKSDPEPATEPASEPSALPAESDASTEPVFETPFVAQDNPATESSTEPSPEPE